MMLAERLTTMESNFDIVTNLENVLSNNVNNLDELFPCNHEEADTRIFLHAKNASDNGIRKLSIVTVDTDVVAVALYHFLSLNLDKLWIENGVGQNRRYLPIHTYAAVLKEENCRALLFWYAVTGCDTVSTFAGRRNKTVWKIWKAFPNATPSLCKVTLFICTFLICTFLTCTY